MKLFAFTLDLESDYAGCINEYEIFKKKEKIDELLRILSSLGIKITVFTVGEIFEKYPDIIKIFEKYDCEFQVHSYSHNLDNNVSEHEIEKAKFAYFAYFKQYPRGYRVPRGRVSGSLVKILEKNGFLYDSSIFPSYFPNPFRYLFCKRNIYYYKNARIMEIPLSSITPLRLTFSISYIKLLGLGFYKNLFRLFELPEVICFDSHLHDFIFNENSYNKLSLFWKFIYGRNKFSGTDYLVELIKQIKKREYRSVYMSEVYDLNRKEMIS